MPMSELASERYTDRIATGPLILVQEVLNTRAAGKPALEDLLDAGFRDVMALQCAGRMEPTYRGGGAGDRGR